MGKRVVMVWFSWFCTSPTPVQTSSATSFENAWSWYSLSGRPK